MTNNKIKTAVVGVTGCIAAYKACSLVRLLQREGLEVKVVMTEPATHFVGPTTFRALTRNTVAVSLWDAASDPIHHVSLAQEADVMVIAPATANCVAKLAHGIADDLLTTTALACDAPLIVAPAMNDRMWAAEATQDNIRTLESRGVVIVGPGTGDLACGTVGSGRLAEEETIAAAVVGALNARESLAGVSVLITAGGTREAIDPVRFIGNRSSGKTGHLLADEAARRGAEVTLVTASELPCMDAVDVVHVESARDMYEAVSARFDQCDVLIATAAVADFRPSEVSEQKIKKDRAPESIELVANPDVLASMSTRRKHQVLVGFAAETESVVEHAMKKLQGKSLDFVVANDVSSPELGFGSDENVVWLVDELGSRLLPRMTKRGIAGAILDKVSATLSGDTSR